MRFQAVLLAMVAVCREAAESMAMFQVQAPRFMKRDSQEKSLAANECHSLLEEDPVFDVKRDRLLIFTTPKAGSSTFQNSMESVAKTGFVDQKRDEYNDDYRHIKTHQSDVAMDYLQKVPDGTTVFVVSMTRHIYARSISSFFQTLCPWVDGKPEDEASCIQEYQEKLTAAGTAMVVDGLIKQYRDGYMSPKHWIEESFQPVVGVDPMACDFNRSKGKLVLQTKWQRLKLIVAFIRLEDNERWQSLLEPMFEGIHIEPKNIGSEKWYSSLYHRFKEAFEYTDAELATLNDNDDFSHFYSTDEQNEFRDSANDDFSRFYSTDEHTESRASAASAE